MARRLEDEQVRATLTELLDWDEMQRSPQLVKFLRYVVEQKLAGNEQNVKAYAIAVDVFGRPANFDPQSDPIVRVQARRLRALLGRYYEESAPSAPVRITLPVGRYVPIFEPLELEQGQPQRDEVLGNTDEGRQVERSTPMTGVEAVATPRATIPRPGAFADGRWLLPGATALVVAIIAVSVAGDLPGWFGTGTVPAVPGPPVVRVGDFVNNTGSAALDGIAEELEQAIAKDLAGYPDIAIANAGSQPSTPVVTFSGSLRQVGDHIEVDGGLPGSWTTKVDMPMPAQDWEIQVSDAARLIVGRLGAYRGPLHAVGRSWIEQQRGVEDHPTTYTCLLRFRAAGEQEKAVGDGDVFTCLDRLLATEPDNAMALVARAWLNLPRAGRTTAGDDVDMDDIKATMDKAVALAPQSSFVHAFRARVLDVSGRHDEAVAEFVAALALSPADLDARASYANALMDTGDWTRAAAEANAALAAAPMPPPWYYGVPMLDAYRRGDWNTAVDDALSFAIADREIGAGVAVAAAAHAGRQNVVERYLPAVLSGTHFRKAGILPRMATVIDDHDLVAAIGEGLVLAGVPRANLDRPS